MSALLLWAGLAAAGEAGDLSTWTLGAVEAAPFVGGGAGVRAGEHLGMHAPLPGGGSFQADVSFMLPSDRLAPGSVALHQLVLDARFGWGTLSLGRQLRLDSRGWLPLDGVSLDVRRSPFFTPTVFAGHVWTPEPGESLSKTWVGGVHLLAHPPDGDGEASRAVTLQAGLLERLSAGALSHSLSAGASLRTPRGDLAALDGELRLGDEAGSRASLRGTAFIGRHLALSPELRWEDLTPDAEVSGLQTPMDWLGGEGYAAGSLAANLRLGAITVSASGGPVMHMDETGLGGLGRGGVGWRGQRASVGAFGSGAAIDGSWVAGGGLEGSVNAERLSARAEAGMFQFQPLSGADAIIGEARGRLTAPLPVAAEDSALALSLDGAVGADRLNRPWARAALLLEGRIGPGGTP